MNENYIGEAFENPPKKTLVETWETGKIWMNYTNLKS